MGQIYRAICDRCGFEFYNYQLKKEWTGAMVCHGPSTNDCWEMRHPQDFIKGRAGSQVLPWTRPVGTDVEISVNFDTSLRGCPPLSIYAQADFAGADCAVAGRFNGSLETL